MPAAPSSPSIRRDWLGACGALYAAMAVALSAYAAHAVAGPAQSQLQTAALFAFGHGAAIAALASGMGGRLARIALMALGLGVLVFSGSLAMHALAQWPTMLAPSGGMLLIAGWILYAVDRLRR